MNFNAMNRAPKIESKPEDVVLKKELGGKSSNEDLSKLENAIKESEAIILPLQKLSKEEISEILEKNPEKISTLMPKLQKLWRITKIVGEAAIVAVAASRMEWTPNEELKGSPESIIALVVTVTMALKVIWDLVGSEKKEATPIKKATI